MVLSHRSRSATDPDNLYKAIAEVIAASSAENSRRFPPPDNAVAPPEH